MSLYVGRPHSCLGCGQWVATDVDRRFGLRRVRVVEMATGLTHFCQGPSPGERAVSTLAAVLSDESRARQDYYRQRAGRSAQAPRPSTTGGPPPSGPVASEGGVESPPAATHEPSSLSDVLEGEAV